MNLAVQRLIDRGNSANNVEFGNRYLANECDRLRAENARLRQELAKAWANSVRPVPLRLVVIEEIS